MTAATRTTTWLTASAWQRLFRDRPVIPLLGLLALLVVVSELVRPGVVTPGWAAVIVRASVPLAILAGCQTLTMLTGGIDLSVGAVASMSGFVVATMLNSPGTPTGIVVALIVVVAIIWIPVRRSRVGLSIYAIGSNQLAAFRSGVPVGRTKVFAYALTGLFSALAGLSLTASTGIWTPVPGPYTLMSVAAVVLGGVSLAGGRGGIVGPIVAVVILQLMRTDMTFLSINTDLATVAQGVILIGVVMIGTLVQLRRARA